MLKRLVLTIVAWLACAGGLRGADAAVAIAWNDVATGIGRLGAISASAPWQFVRDPIAVGLDTVLHSAFGRLFVLSTRDDTVRVVNPLTWTIERTHRLDSGDEPVDIKVVSSQVAYISRRNAPQLLRLDLASGMTQPGVDLDVFADKDGNPDLGTMLVHDGRLFVQIQRQYFDDPPPFPRPLVAVVDIASERLIDVDPTREGMQAIELAGTFPKMKMQVEPQSQKLFVSASGAFFDAGGIEVVNLESLRSEGLAIREADDMTGADLGALVMVGPQRGFLVYSTDLLLSSHLHQFSLAGGVDPKELGVALDYFSPAIEFDPGTSSVFFPVGGFGQNGLHVFDAATGARLSESLIPTSGPPTDLVLLAAIPEPGTLVLALFASLLAVSAAFRQRWRSTQGGSGRCLSCTSACVRIDSLPPADEAQPTTTFPSGMMP